MAEKKEFKLHKAALYSIIVAQAGTFEKALLELVMNAVDAGSTKVEVELTNKTFRVSDDGRGFAGEYEIEHYFGTFGTPHVEGDATYGKFRMGRGQVMAFTKNTWRSNDFRMEVDIKHKGDHYEFEKGLPHQPGCTIEGTLYDPLQSTERLAVERNLAEMTQYVGIDVLVNGTLTSKKQLDQKWTFEDGNAYYLLTPNRDRLTIYNLGVLVKETWGSDFGMGGIVLSKKQLTVNMARNDVLVSQCPVWKDITKRIRAHVAQYSRGEKVVKNEAWRQMKARALLAGAFEPDEDLGALTREKLFTLIDGKNVNLEDLAHLVRQGPQHGKALPLVVARSGDDVRADQAHKAGFAVVLASKVPSRFGVYGDLKELFQGILKGLTTAIAQDANTSLRGLRRCDVENALRVLIQQAAPAKALEDFQGALATTVPDKDLDAFALRVLQTLRAEQVRLFWRGTMRSPSGEILSPRELLAGKSEGFNAWTNGSDRIWIDVRNLKVSGSTFDNLVRYAARMATLLVHEYMHSNDSRESAVHSTEFYEAFERAVCFQEAVGNFVSGFVERWVRESIRLEKAGAKRALRAGEVKAANLLEQLGEDLEAPTPPIADDRADDAAPPWRLAAHGG